MKSLVLSLMLLGNAALVSTPAIAQCKLSREPAPNGERLIMENEQVRVELLSFGGRVNSLRIKDSGAELLEPVEESVLTRSPLLPPILLSNQGGYSDWFWGEPPPEPTGFTTEVIDESADRLEVRMKGGAGQWQIERSVTLEKGSKTLVQDVKITLADGNTAKLGYWAHLIPNAARFVGPDGGSRLLIPGRRGGNAIAQRTTTELPKDGVQTVITHRSNDFYELSAPWAAIISPRSGEVILLRSTSDAFGDEGLLYHWQNGKLSTLELIHRGAPLAPGQSARYHITLEPFASEADLLSAVSSLSKP